MLKIWGRTSSINVRKVLWTAQELGLPFEHIEAGGPFGRVRTPEFMALNPNATVPLLEDDGTGKQPQGRNDRGDRGGDRRGGGGGDRGGDRRPNNRN